MEHSTADVKGNADAFDRLNAAGQTAQSPRLGTEGVHEPVWADDEMSGPGYLGAELATGLASLPFLGAAIRRKMAFCCAAAVAGLALGLGAYVLKPPPYKASTTVLLAQNPDQNPMDAVLTDVALAQTRAVAGPVVRRLRIQENVDKFLGSYTVVALTDRVIVITVSAPSSAQAVQRAAALAAGFLSFRSHELISQQRLTLTLLDQKISTVKARLAAIGSRIASLSALPGSPERKAKLSLDRAQSQQVSSNLIELQQAVLTFRAGSQVATTSMIAGSGVLDRAAPLPRSHFRTLPVYAVAGLIAGLVLGICAVVVQTLVTSRLRRRDDVAVTLGAPVRLSVGKVRLRWHRFDRWLGRRLPGGKLRAERRLAAPAGRDIQRVIAYLRTALPQRPGDQGLAVVAVGNPRVAILSVLALAFSRARHGTRVMVADLTTGALAAKLLGVADPGLHVVTQNGTRLTVVVPDPDGIAPIGPVLPAGQASTGQASAEQASAAPTDQLLSDAYGSTDLLLTVATLDPALGADYLPTWASSAVVMVTAGQSTVTRIAAAGDMIRLSGTPMSAVLLSADKDDESFGAVPAPERAGTDATDEIAMAEVDEVSIGHKLIMQPEGARAGTGSEERQARLTAQGHTSLV